MAKEKAATIPVWQELFLHSGLYTRSQGRVVRQVTFAALAITVGLGVWELQRNLAFYQSFWLSYALPAAIALVGWWLCFRVVNLPRFADFLIAVEAEMNKVSWPSRTELIRSSLVVIFVIFFMAFLLFGYDVAWKYIFTLIGVLRGAPSEDA